MFGFPASIDPSATHALECPIMSDFYASPEEKEAYQKDMMTLRAQLGEFFEHKPFPTKFMYFVTRLDFYKPDPNAGDEDDDEGDSGSAGGSTATTATATTTTTKDSTSAADDSSNGAASAAEAREMNELVSVYVAICGNGSVMVPMAIFPPTEDWHWERKKPVKLRHAYSMHRTKVHDPHEALQFFAVTWKKFYDEEAKYSDKFAFLLDAEIAEFQSPEFTDGLKQLEGHGKYWTTFLTVRNPLRQSHFEDILSMFVADEWRAILAMKKSAQPNDYRKCVAFWFYTAWEFFAGDHARTAFRSCNMFLEDKSTWCSAVEDDGNSVV